MNEELRFLNYIKEKINIIFDVGCRDYSLFTTLEKEIHYFDPREDFIEKLKNQPNSNTKSIFNSFGLSDKNEDIEYNISHESFFDRSFTMGISSEKKILKVKKAKDYIIKNNINNIDFLKIDTEGYELKVLKGFKDYLKNVNIIQFEYGGTYSDAKITLKEVINYLNLYNFDKFYYLRPDKLEFITDYTDHYHYSNIVCFNNLLNKNILLNEDIIYN